MNLDLIPLINEYVRTTTSVFQELTDAFSESDLLRAHRKRLIRSGEEVPGKHWTITFHGMGCTIEDLKGGEIVDFDFGPNGRVDGFDAWRLYRFASNHVAHFPEWQNHKLVADALACLEKAAIVKRLPDSHLFFLSDQ